MPSEQRPFRYHGFSAPICFGIFIDFFNCTWSIRCVFFLSRLWRGIGKQTCSAIFTVDLQILYGLKCYHFKVYRIYLFLWQLFHGTIKYLDQCIHWAFSTDCCSFCYKSNIDLTRFFRVIKHTLVFDGFFKTVYSSHWF